MSIKKKIVQSVSRSMLADQGSLATDPCCIVHVAYWPTQRPVARHGRYVIHRHTTSWCCCVWVWLAETTAHPTRSRNRTEWL